MPPYKSCPCIYISFLLFILWQFPLQFSGLITLASFINEDKGLIETILFLEYDANAYVLLNCLITLINCFRSFF